LLIELMAAADIDVIVNNYDAGGYGSEEMAMYFGRWCLLR
jgi:hypothetical protein